MNCDCVLLWKIESKQSTSILAVRKRLLYKNIKVITESVLEMYRKITAFEVDNNKIVYSL